MRLKTRLFLWFFAAIVIASISSILSVAIINPGPPRLPSGMMVHTIAQRVETLWDDPVASETYIAEMRELTGYAFELHRDPRSFPENAHRGADHPHHPFLLDDGNDRPPHRPFLLDDGNGYIPITRHGELLGTVSFPAGFVHTRWFRLLAGLLAGALVLSIAAGRVSRTLARPLERIADAAHRFGDGELEARTGIGEAHGREVADEVHQVAGAFDSMAERVERTLRDQR
ncbi:MAG TPA: HAMP domain-containing protein, partial [Polyangiaceae bacterium]|nr:HAMP domain-containing protein [Polyangiaceae bacterium]